MKLKNVEHELTQEEKQDFIQEFTVDEIFDLINWNTGNHVNGFIKSEIIERVLDDHSEYLISASKISNLLDEMPDREDCRTIMEAFAVQELEAMF